MHLEKRNNAGLKLSDALKGFLFRAYHACRCGNVGQVVPDNQIKRHSRKSLSGIPTSFNNAQARDPRTLRAAFSGMTTHFKEEALNKNTFRAPLRSGFTLIELLVVILIIAILAAIALPQYQVAVRKARYAEAILVGNTLGKAENLFYLTHGKYTKELEKLDVSISTDNVPVVVWTNTSEVGGYIGTAVKNTSLQYLFYLSNGKMQDMQCRASADNALDVNVCKAATGRGCIKQGGVSYCISLFK